VCPVLSQKEKKKVLACARPIFHLQDSFFKNFLAHVTTVGGGDAQLARAIDFNKLSASLLLFF
jgi:hypothetical protein